MKLRYSQKTENKLKVCQESIYMPQKVSEFTIPITNKYGKSKVWDDCGGTIIRDSRVVFDIEKVP